MLTDRLFELKNTKVENLQSFSFLGKNSTFVFLWVILSFLVSGQKYIPNPQSYVKEADEWHTVVEKTNFLENILQKLRFEHVVPDAAANGPCKMDLSEAPTDIKNEELPCEYSVGG